MESKTILPLKQDKADHHQQKNMRLSDQKYTQKISKRYTMKRLVHRIYSHYIAYRRNMRYRNVVRNMI